MKLIENMNLEELQAEKEKHLKKIEKNNKKLEKINSKNTYQDEMSKHFHLGLVGFRKDRKRVNREIDRTVDDAVEFTKCYKNVKNSECIVNSINKKIDFISKNKESGNTEEEIKENQKRKLLNSAKNLKWEKVQGHYGVAYQHKDFIVERIESNFVVVRQNNNNIWQGATVKDGKKFVSLLLEKIENTREVVNEN